MYSISAAQFLVDALSRTPEERENATEQDMARCALSAHDRLRKRAWLSGWVQRLRPAWHRHPAIVTGEP